MSGELGFNDINSTARYIYNQILLGFCIILLGVHNLDVKFKHFHRFQQTTGTLTLSLAFMSSYLITGSSRGIGLELVRQLADKAKEDVGTIFASARTSNGSSFQALLQQHPGRIVFVPLDVTDAESISNATKLVSTVLKGKGLDVLINNAGVMKYGPIEQM